MIYNSYDEVPDGAMCKPLLSGLAFAKKDTWYGDKKRKWETEEKPMDIKDNLENCKHEYISFVTGKPEKIVLYVCSKCGLNKPI